MFRRWSAPGILLLLCFASPLVADEPRLWMEPLGPTTSTPIVFWHSASCEGLESISRQGNVITILLTFGPCSPPRTEPLRIPLAERTLPAGEYRVDVSISAGPAPPIVNESMTFIVRHDGNDAVRFRVRPSVALSVGGVPLLIEPEDPSDELCPNDCDVFIGGVKVPKEHFRPGLRVIAPPHAGGLVDVTIATNDGSSTVGNILYYYEPDELPLFSVFERILFPILADQAGAGGSLWRMETSIANPNRFAIDNANHVRPLVCVTFPCGERMDPRTFVRFEGGEYPHGVALLAPRAEAPYLSFASRVRDVSREDDNFGTEIPVVRERDMVRRGAVSLLDVPLDPRYRVKLRVYAFDDSDGQQLGTTVVFQDVTTRARRVEPLLLSRTCTGNACASTPYYAELNLPPATGARTNLYIDVPTPNMVQPLKWAFASVTNNKTQQVTIVSANGAGGAPCTECQP